MPIINVIKGGSTFKDRKRPIAVVHHILIPEREWGGRGNSLCGDTTGPYGKGWVKTDKVVTCIKCIKKYQKQSNGTK